MKKISSIILAMALVMTVLFAIPASAEMTYSDNLITDAMTTVAGNYHFAEQWNASNPLPVVETEGTKGYVNADTDFVGGCSYIIFHPTGILDTTTPGADVYLAEFDYISTVGPLEAWGCYHITSWAAAGSADLYRAVLPKTTESGAHFKAHFVIEAGAQMSGGFSFLFYNKGSGTTRISNFSVKKVLSGGEEYIESENMIKNPGFENGVEGVSAANWTFSKYAAAGEAAIPTIATENGNSYIAQSGWGGVMTQEFPVEGGTTGTFLFEFDYKTSVQVNVWIQLIGDDGVTYLDFNPLLADTANWNSSKSIVKLNNFAGTKLTIRFVGTRDGQNCCLDNFSFRRYDQYDETNLFKDPGFEFVKGVGAHTLTVTNGSAYPYDAVVWMTSHIVTGGEDNTLTATEGDKFIEAKSGNNMLFVPNSQGLGLTLEIGTDSNPYAEEGYTLSFDVYRANSGMNGFSVWVESVYSDGTGDGRNYANATYKTETVYTGYNYSGNPDGRTPEDKAKEYQQWNHVSIDLKPILDARHPAGSAKTAADIRKFSFLIQTGWGDDLYIDNLALTPNVTNLDVIDADNLLVNSLPEAAEDITVRAANYSGAAAKVMIATYSTGASGKQVLESVTPVDIADKARITSTIAAAQKAAGKTVKVYMWTDKTPVVENVTLK